MSIYSVLVAVAMAVRLFSYNNHPVGLFTECFYIHCLEANVPKSTNNDNRSGLYSGQDINRRYIVALQVGHWKNTELPEELMSLRSNNGAASGIYNEWQVNYKIAELTAEILRSEGFEVQLLPATIPPGLIADIFIAVHTDQNPDKRRSGFKAAGAWHDQTGRSARLAKIIEREYIISTGFKQDDQYTLAMTNYYAFNHYRFKHALSPSITSVIVETGYLSNPSDQDALLHRPKIAARGIANGIIKYVSY